jgi:hypothetical protein
MNQQLSELVELALRKHVERAVRPVKATSQRKMKMREELLAHLTGIFAEEIECRGNEEAAIAASCERFGPPGEITAELDRSIGKAERLGWAIERYERLLDRTFGRWPNESLLQYLVRSAGAITALTVGMLVVVCGIVWSVGGVPDSGSQLLLPRLLPVMIVGNWTALFAAYSVDKMKPRGATRWLLLLVQSGLWSLLLTAVMGWFWWSIGARPLTIAFLAQLGVEIWAIVAGLIFLIALTCDYTQRIRQTREAWTKLEIEEQ